MTAWRPALSCGIAFAVLSHVATAAAQAAKIRDSSGVRIIENGARAQAPAVFTLAVKPSLDIGGLETNPDDEFDSKQGYLRATRLSDGGLAVIDVVRVHYFNASGKRIRIAARKGQGPGEMLYATSVCSTRGDTVVANDDHNRRVAIFDRNGVAVRTIAQGDRGGTPFDGCFDDGSFVVVKDIPKGRGMPGEVQLTRLRLDGTVANEIGVFPRPAIDMATFNEATSIAAGQRFYYADAQSPEVRVYTPQGKLVTIIRTADAPDKLTEAEIESRLQGTIPTNVTAAERKERMDRMRAQPHATAWPPYSQVHVDANGLLWIRDFQKTYPGPVAWTAFDANGRMIGRLVLPAPEKGARALQVIGFGKNEILVRRSDDDGAAHLTVYPILGGLPANRGGN